MARRKDISEIEIKELPMTLISETNVSDNKENYLRKDIHRIIKQNMIKSRINEDRIRNKKMIFSWMYIGKDG